jgi:hypothetical protein
MQSRSVLAVACCGVVACSRGGTSASPALSTPSAAIAPSGDVPVPIARPATSAREAATLTEELKRHSSGTPLLQAGPFDWPERGSSALVFDQYGDREGSDRYQLLWAAPGEGGGEVDALGGSLQLLTPLAARRVAARGVARDVDGDGEPELVVFTGPPAQNQELPTTWIFKVLHDPARNNRGVVEMHRLEYQVLGATDEASLDRELATQGLGVRADSSPLRLLARMPQATAAEVQVLVGPAGVRLCRRKDSARKCTSVSQKAVDASQVAEMVALGGVIDAFAAGPELVPQAKGLMPPQPCEKAAGSPARLDCRLTDGETTRAEWIFEATPAGPRLAEVWKIDDAYKP